MTPVRLVDDELAVSLAPGGRLDTLLSAADFATGPTIDPGGRVNGALCLAIDPDLLVTVNAMSAGYVVSDNPDDRNSPTHPGTGPGRGSRTGWTGCARWPTGCASRRRRMRRQISMRCTGSAIPDWRPPLPTAPATSSTRSWA